MKKIYALLISALFCTFFMVSCGNSNKNKSNNETELPQISSVQKSHKWYYFTRDAIEQIDLPQNAPQIIELPWTEAIRISSAASIPQKYIANSEYKAYAVVNRLGMLAFAEDHINVYNDNSIFPSVTADQLVFSGGMPVFYLYRSSFFNDSSIQTDKEPFLVEFNPTTHLFFPLVSYKNLNLTEDEQIIGFFWDGYTWTCSAKKRLERQVEFKFFTWQPLIDLTELSPALSSDNYIFKAATEEEYKTLNMPHLFKEAPENLKSLVSSIPSDFTFYVSWRDSSGTSPINYYQPGNNSSATINAKGLYDNVTGYEVIVFADGTTYFRKNNSSDSEDSNICAFRLPLLPAGYTYGEVAIAGDSLYVAWEENNFYKTGRAGFIQVSISQVLNSLN